MEQALKTFTEHQNLRCFMLSIINSNHTPFIIKLSELNGKSPNVNVLEQRAMVNSLLKSIHKVRRYFDSKKIKTYDDFLYSDAETPQIVFNYVINGLYNKMSRPQCEEILFTILEPYCCKNPEQIGEIDS